MRVKKFSNRLVSLSLAVVVVVAACPFLNAACASANSAHSTASKPATSPMAAANDAVTEWNQKAVSLTLASAPPLAPIQQARVMAIFQLAVHDAVNGITGEYETYLSPPAAPQNASPEAAAIAAAHHALKNLFPASVGELDFQYVISLTLHGLSLSDPGIEFGRSAAAAILAARANDHSGEAQFPYDAPGAGNPGVWVRLNNAPALLPGWGNVTPFVIRSASQFDPGPPPALNSDTYTTDYNEIKQIGVKLSSTRTSEQSDIAQFWRASPTAIWNSALTQVMETRNLNLSEKARVFALMYLAAGDASIACWGTKYEYNFWRPEPAIISGGLDGNDSTIADASWQPFIPTPPFPEYPSGHATNSSAMAKVLMLEFGDNPGVPITVTLSGITRNWNSFSEGVQEVIDARVYSGIHFRNSDEVGARMGRQIAQFVSHHALRRSSKP